MQPNGWIPRTACDLRFSGGESNQEEQGNARSADFLGSLITVKEIWRRHERNLSGVLPTSGGDRELC